MRYVIYSTETGAIRAVISGSLALAQMNVGDGEALVQHFGYCSARTHEVRDGQVVMKA